MGDLSIETAWVCTTNVSWTRKVKGSKGEYTVRFCFQPSGEVQYDYECDCRAFKYRRGGQRYCKHIESVKHERCGWNGVLEPTARAKQVGDKYVCPQCGGPVEAIRVGV